MYVLVCVCVVQACVIHTCVYKHVYESLVVVGPEKRSCPRNDTLPTFYYILEQEEKKKKKCLTFYRLKQRRLMHICRIQVGQLADTSYMRAIIGIYIVIITTIFVVPIIIEQYQIRN